MYVVQHPEATMKRILHPRSSGQLEPLVRHTPTILNNFVFVAPIIKKDEYGYFNSSIIHCKMCM